MQKLEFAGMIFSKYRSFGSVCVIRDGLCNTDIISYHNHYYIMPCVGALMEMKLL